MSAVLPSMCTGTMSFGLRRNRALQGDGVHVVGVIDVDDDRNGTNGDDCLYGRHERERLRDHVIARPHAEGEHGDILRNRSGRDSLCVRTADLFGESLFELPYAIPTVAQTDKAVREHHTVAVVEDRIDRGALFISNQFESWHRINPH